MKGVLKGSLIVIFVLYVIVLSKVILLKHFSIPDALNQITHFRMDFLHYGWEEASFIPFQTLTNYIFHSEIPLAAKIENIAKTTIAFAPLGSILPFLSNKFFQFKFILITVLSISVTFEMIQLIFKFGVFDIDDILLYTIGCIVGYAPIKVLQMIKVPNRTIIRKVEV